MTTTPVRTTPATGRSVARVVPPFHTFEGAGFPVRRPFPTAELPLLDPFLMVDQVGPVDLAPGEAKGAPPHPHRGFETIQYVIDGDIANADSRGHRAVVRGGGVQWLTAGSGIVHEALPTPEFLAAGGRQHMLQIWVNLPARLKGVPPHSQNAEAADLPVVRTAEGAELIVLAGTTHGATAPFETRTPLLVVHARLAAGGSAKFTAPAHHTAAFHTLTGRAVTAGVPLPDGHLAVLDHDGESFTVRAVDGPAEVLVLAGEPIGEPVARSGPFVMNTVAELHRAQQDHSRGLMGRMPA